MHSGRAHTWLRAGAVGGAASVADRLTASEADVRASGVVCGARAEADVASHGILALSSDVAVLPRARTFIEVGKASSSSVAGAGAIAGGFHTDSAVHTVLRAGGIASGLSISRVAGRAL